MGAAFGARSPIETLRSSWRRRERARALARWRSSPARAATRSSSPRATARWTVTRAGVGTLLLLREGGAPRLRLEADTTALLFGGQPLGTRILQGNFIASSAELLDRALRELS